MSEPLEMRKLLNTKFHENPVSGFLVVVICGRMDKYCAVEAHILQSFAVKTPTTNMITCTEKELPGLETTGAFT
jgi:hypothetical protein